jgi:hypothetical protein
VCRHFRFWHKSNPEAGRHIAQGDAQVFTPAAQI